MSWRTRINVVLQCCMTVYNRSFNQVLVIDTSITGSMLFHSIALQNPELCYQLSALKLSSAFIRNGSEESGFELTTLHIVA